MEDVYLFVLLQGIFVSRTSLFCVFCYFLQASGAIYQSVYASLTCSGSPTTTLKLASTTCVATANGRQSTNVYVSTAGLPTAGATYTVASYSASCGSPSQYIYVTQTPSCTSSGTCQSAQGAFGGLTTLCPSGSGQVAVSPGSVTTGYAVVSILFAASDTQCTGQSFTSGQAYVLGICITGYATTGSTSGMMFTSDVRCVFICSSSPRYLCVTHVYVVCLLFFFTGIGCYIYVSICFIDL